MIPALILFGIPLLFLAGAYFVFWCLNNIL